MFAKVVSHLPYLAAVAKHQSFSKAANDIALTQSALSYQIQKLEEKLGFKVCTRGKGSKVELTKKGELLVDEFNLLEKSFNQVLDDVQTHHNKKTFKISAPVDFGVKVLTRLLPYFEKENISLELDLNDDIIFLKKSNFDFAIRNNTDEQGVAYLELLHDDNVAFCSTEYAEKHSLNTVADITHAHRLIVRNKTKSRSWESVFNQAGGSFAAHPNKQLITNSFGILTSTLAGYGVCILPKYFVADLGANQAITVLENGVEPTTFFIAYQASSAANKWAQLIKKIIVEQSTHA